MFEERRSHGLRSFMLPILALAATLQNPADFVWSQHHALGAAAETAVGSVAGPAGGSHSIVEIAGQLGRVDLDLEGALLGAQWLDALDGALPEDVSPGGSVGEIAVALTVPETSSFAGAALGGRDVALAVYGSSGAVLRIRLGTAFDDEARAVLPDGQGGTLVLGTTDLPATGLGAGRSAATLWRIDAAGGVQWMRLFPFGGTVAASFHAEAMALDPAGSRVLCVGWSTSGAGDTLAASCAVGLDGTPGAVEILGPPGSALMGVAEAGSAGFLAVGRAGSPAGSALLAPLDLNGRPAGPIQPILASHHSWGSTSLEHAVPDGAGGVLALGRTSDHDDPLVRSSALLVRLAPGGAVLWRHVTDSSADHASFPRSLDPLGPGGALALAHGEVSADGSSAGLTAIRAETRGVHDTSCPAAPHSGGERAQLRAIGSSLAEDSALMLRTHAVLPGSFGIFVCAQAGGAPIAGGLCLSGPIGRFVEPGQIWMADGSGQAHLRLDLARLPLGPGHVAAAAGETWHFQGWFRDGPGSAFTSGAAVTLR